MTRPPSSMSERQAIVQLITIRCTNFSLFAASSFLLLFVSTTAQRLHAWGQTPETNQSPKASSATSAKSSTTAGPNAQDIANQVNNPAAPVTLLQLRDVLMPDFPGSNGAATALQLQPVLPIGPFESFRHVQLVKINLAIYENIPSLSFGDIHEVGDAGFGDMQFFDLLSIKQTWGRWGFGPSLVFPTASEKDLGAGKWQAGPAAALIYSKINNLTIGAVVQNPISFAGDSAKADVNQMIVTPTLTYTLREGWFVGLADYNWTFNWKNGGDATFPLGAQIGKVVRIGKQPVSVSFEAGGTVARPDGVPNPGWILGFEFSPVFNFHVGPNEKVRLRR